jgi:endonuclease/exonuclease/phosphatase family metal-dependent hydrolase
VSSKDSSVLTVMTLNIWGVHEWEHRRDALVGWVEEVGPDLLALQEVTRSDDLCQASWIAERTGMTAVFGAASTKPIGEFGNAVLSRHPIHGSQVHRLTDGGTGNEPRAMTTADVEVARRRFWFSSTHLSYKFDEGWVRERQVLDIAAVIDEAPKGDFPPIVCGDFNATPASTEVRFLKGLHALDGRSFQVFDAFEVANPGEPGSTWLDANPYAAANMVPEQRIDYIFVGVRSQDGAGRVLSARVVCDEPRDGAWASDHVGVAAELALPAG